MSSASLLVLLGLMAIVIFTYPGLNSPNQAQFSPEPTPTPSPVTTPGPDEPGRGGPVTTPAGPKLVPAQIVDLTNWKLALPQDTALPGHPDTILQPDLAIYTNKQFFIATPGGDGIIFRANAGGATTRNSHYPRSELREMSNNGASEASWSNRSGTHQMIIKEAITHLPVAKPSLVAGQIHDASDDVIMIKLDHKHLFVEARSKNIGDLDNNYVLGTIFTINIIASNGHIKVFYNDQLKTDYAKSGSGYYFKSGCYTQSNITKGDAFNAYGEVIVYGLSVTHA